MKHMRNIVTDLDRAWYEINALGGSAPSDDPRTTAVNETVEAALAILERLGARDPIANMETYQ